MFEWVFQAYAKLYWYPMFKLNLVDSKISKRFSISRHVQRVFRIKRKIFHPNLMNWNFERIQWRAETRNFAKFSSSDKQVLSYKRSEIQNYLIFSKTLIKPQNSENCGTIFSINQLTKSTLTKTYTIKVWQIF